MLADLARLSINQMTTEQWNVQQTVDGCARHGIPWVGLWRHKVTETGLAQSARIVRDAGVRVSSLCRGGMFPAATEAERLARIDDNRRAVDEAVELGTDTLVLVCGPAPDRDLRAARQMVHDGIAAVMPYARERGVKLGIEPLHPMFAGDRSVISTLAQALDIAEHFAPDEVGVIVDVYHVWWDPAVEAQIARAAGRILGFHVNDWIMPITDMLNGRGMMGDGVIEINRYRGMVEQAGYHGPIEVEIFNRDLAAMDGDTVLDTTCRRFMEHV